jgi:UDP-GlcNAc:undecaprenyl-phosphate GlcNAc-1-phosphate transferase
MNTFILLGVSAVAAFLCNLLVTPLLLKLSHTHHWYDEVNHRKIHSGDIPRIGGVGITISFFFGVFVFFLLSRLFVPEIFGRMAGIIRRGADYWPILTGIFLVQLMGLVDDFINIRPWQKLLVQLGSAVLIVLFGYYYRVISLPGLGIRFSMGPFGGVLTVLWIVGLGNAINLIDGLDGLAGGVSALAALFISIVAVQLGAPVTAVFALVLFAASLGFLVFNFPPAKIFMGDSGSYFLGYTLAVLPLTVSGAGFPAGSAVLPGGLLETLDGVMPSSEALEAMSIILTVTITMTAVPILDTIAAILRRLRKRKPVHSADRNHLHHKLLDFNCSNRTILAIVYGTSSFFGIICVIAAGLPYPSLLFILPALWVLTVAGFLVLDRFYRGHPACGD